MFEDQVVFFTVEALIVFYSLSTISGFLNILTLAILLALILFDNIDYTTKSNFLDLDLLHWSLILDY